MVETGAPSLKDFVDAALVERIAARFVAVHPQFDSAGFIAAATDGLDALELKDRTLHIATALGGFLPEEYPEAIAVVVAAADHPDPPIDGWSGWPLNSFIEVFGIDWPTESLDAMEHLTRHASSEFAIRHFLEHHRDETFVRLHEWVIDPDEDVRRLVSEGTRPFLPWGKRVTGLREDPEPGIALLDRLFRDSSEYVRRSVANHLNDISRDHPERAVEVAGRWRADPSEETAALVAHALRTLVKRGDPGALAVLGFATEAEVEVLEFTGTPDRLRIGDRLALRALVKSTAEERVPTTADWVVHYVKANGTTSPKVFKGPVLELDQGEEFELRKNLSLRDLTTRTHHPGTHRVELQVAGTAVAEVTFELEE